MIQLRMGLRTLIIEQRAFYRSIVSIFCPILNETVYFTSEGFNHLLYESYWKPRSPAEQFLKLKCLSMVPEVVKNCSKKANIRKMRRKVKGKWKNGFHFELVHEIKKGASVRVIVERIGTGRYKFWSVMPHNNKSKKALTPTKKPS